MFAGCDDQKQFQKNDLAMILCNYVLQAPQQEVAFRGSVKPLRAVPVARRNVARAASCSAEERAPLGKAVAAAALAAALAFGSVEAAKADISGLTPCSESKGFAKRQKNELKALDKRLKKVSAGVVSALQALPWDQALPSGHVLLSAEHQCTKHLQTKCGAVIHFPNDQ